MTVTSEFNIMEFHISNNARMYYYTGSNDYNSGSLFRAHVGQHGNFFVDDPTVCGAQTITLHEEPSEELLDFLITFATNLDEVVLPTLSNPAATGDVLAGKEYIDASGNKKIGTIPASSGIRVIPGTVDKVAVNAGYYVESDAVVAGDSNLIASNIKKDTTIFGVTGSYEGGGLTVNDMSIGTVGAMPSGDLSLTVTDPSGNFAWKTYEPLVTQRLLPEKIIAGENILGVVGTRLLLR